MIFRETALSGAYLIETEKRSDDRGAFVRTWCRDEFAAQGLELDCVQRNLSINTQRGTLRGMHYQTEPHGETKLIRCSRGALYDVIIDLRPASPTYRRWTGVELREDNDRMLFVPKGFAHGFQTLVDGTEVTYLVDYPYVPGAGRGVRYDDPALGIPWPLPVTRISPQDQAWPSLADAAAEWEAIQAG
jgi:dTDP-4-dehydrorhamnose 3,5-epimerase